MPDEHEFRVEPWIDDPVIRAAIEGGITVKEVLFREGEETRLLKDAESFTKEITSLDEAGFLARTLAVLGIPEETEARP